MNIRFETSELMLVLSYVFYQESKYIGIALLALGLLTAFVRFGLSNSAKSISTDKSPNVGNAKFFIKKKDQKAIH